MTTALTHLATVSPSNVIEMLFQVGTSQWHGASLEPGQSADALIGMLQADFSRRSLSPISDDDVSRIKSQAVESHTPDVVAAFEADKAARAVLG